ncbi:enoyl-CoA hydratase/isomerase family protein [Thalassobius vesicularis]|uniref:Enoyl-CoA hydratase/isomerase family protein n=1 Tax=Thalassobius vesicularis TaxID=1294297 RepID=A0A4S3MEH5_9RHOB|nr:enoyl-CoA hydratase/isomerase family protein [Thalassobius vesicularis]THD76696.1 enoyl-CoA hydratase/isomerase family protein [Thalassobius vesicularis]
MIELEKDNGLWVVTINRPDKANSLTAGMLEQLCEIYEGAAEARVVILTGTGKVFSAGADLDEARAGLATSPLWERLSGTVAALPGLTIAALNGTLAGGANGMVLACDIRLAVPGAKFFYPVMKLGYLPQPSDPGRMAALIGPSRTKLILMGGQKIPAEEALAFGLVDRLIDGDVVAAAKEIATDTLAAKPEIAAGIKALCN